MEPLATLVIVTGGACAGVLAGLGGAVFMVPLLLLVGLEPASAATAGLLAVLTASVAAAPQQLGQQLTNHRLGVTIEAGASLGVVLGALALSQVTEGVFRVILVLAVLLAAGLSAIRKGVRNLPDDALSQADVGEHPGELAGAYALRTQVVPYRAKRIRLGILCSLGIGMVAGLTGTSGGYLKTPMMSEIMHVPVKVAAATTTFASGLTALTGLAILLPQGHLAPRLIGVVVLGAVLGGAGGSALQAFVDPVSARRFLQVSLLVIVAVIVWPI